VSVTISIGVAERNERLLTPEEVIQAADKALYRAKRAGRNRVNR
jgi:diguanylate cyclase (GGDEF)-like protein